MSTFYLASRRIPGLVRHPVWSGVAYGIAVYFGDLALADAVHRVKRLRARPDHVRLA